MDMNLTQYLKDGLVACGLMLPVTIALCSKMRSERILRHLS